MRQRPGPRLALVAVVVLGSACSTSAARSAGPASSIAPVTSSSTTPRRSTTTRSHPSTSLALPKPTPSSTPITRPATSTTSSPTAPTEPVVVAAGDRPLAGRTVHIDAGHNGANHLHLAEIDRPVNIITKTITCDTTGTAGGDGYTESAFNLDVALRLQTLLVAEGARVVMTRTNDSGWGPCVNERAAIGNRAHADAAISIHADGNTASGARGFHVLEPLDVPGYNDAIIAPSARFALEVRDAFEGTGMPVSNYVGGGGIVGRNDLGGLNFSRVPKVFIECGNMRNATDLALLESAAWRERAAEAMAAALTEFLARA